MKRPWFPLYVNDFLADTMLLSAEETGCYLLLLMICWQRPNCDFPNDMKWLKKSLARMVSDIHGNRFNRVIPKLLDLYFVLDVDGCWRNPRLLKEREIAEKFARKQSENSRKRWSRSSDFNYLVDPVGIPARTRHNHIDKITTTVSVEREKLAEVVAPKRPDALSRAELEAIFANRRNGKPN